MATKKTQEKSSVSGTHKKLPNPFKSFSILRNNKRYSLVECSVAKDGTVSHIEVHEPTSLYHAFNDFKYVTATYLKRIWDNLDTD